MVKVGWHQSDLCSSRVLQVNKQNSYKMANTFDSLVLNEGPPCNRRSPNPSKKVENDYSTVIVAAVPENAAVSVPRAVINVLAAASAAGRVPADQLNVATSPDTVK